MLRHGLVVGLALALVACGPPDNPGRRAEAVEVSRQFLLAVTGGHADRGWSLIHPASQVPWGGEDNWVDAAEAVDWSGFEFNVLGARYCDDGVICPVAIDIPGGEDSIPDLIKWCDDADGGIVFMGETEGLEGNAELWVVLPDLLRGPGGVHVPRP